MRDVGVLLAVVIGSISCGMGMGGARSSEALSAATKALSARVEAHHARVVAAQSREAALAEVDAYATEAPPLLVATMSACAGMMMSAPEHPEFVGELLTAAVREHAVQMHVASTLTDVEAICEAHVARAERSPWRAYSPG